MNFLNDLPDEGESDEGGAIGKITTSLERIDEKSEIVQDTMERFVMTAIEKMFKENEYRYVIFTSLLFPFCFAGIGLLVGSLLSS